MDYIKVNDNEIKVVTTKEEVHTYPYEWLIEQRDDVQKKKDAVIALYDKELTELDILIAKCKELGVAEKVVEEPIIVDVSDSGEVIGIK
jgi:hypothetical protein